LAALLKRIRPRRDENGDCHDEEIEGDADFDVIAKAITAGPINHKVGLITDRRGKAGGGGHHDSDDEGDVTDVERVRSGEGERKHERGGGVVILRNG